ncbi:MAG: carbon-nitrogen hydrolase [Polyangiaceae bacterium]|nr:carbon-nitrogen hydrolase [Polyangiaceae bacterium]
MEPRNLRVGLVQSHLAGDVPEMLARTAGYVRKARARGAELVCLQELFAAPYFCQVEDARYFSLAEELNGPTCTHMAKLAQECSITLVVPFFERRAAGLYHNSLVVFGPEGQRLGMYRKMHIPDDPQFEEKFYFTPGDLGFVNVPTPKVELGTLICWDQWYPEAARLTALKGAELLVYPTAIGWLTEEKAEHGATQLSAWQTLQRSHAIANGVFVLAANRVGVETIEGKSIEFWGHSFVCDPTGTVLAQAGTGEEVLVVDCDLTLVEKSRQVWPFFRDRRTDAYSGLTERWSKP